jgi:hypothetical protein
MTPDPIIDEGLGGIGSDDSRIRGLGTAAAPAATGVPIVLPYGVLETVEEHLLLLSDRPLTALETRYLTQCQLVPGPPYSLFMTVADCTRTPYVTWSVMTSRNARIDIVGALDFFWTDPSVLFTQNVTGGTLATPYDLASPYNQSGFVVITQPFIQIQITDTSGLGHAASRFYFHFW